MAIPVDRSMPWRQEYKRQGIPSSFRTDPSGSVVTFHRLLREQGIVEGRIIDVGCGTGRNSLYLAKHGYDVTSLDFVPEMIAGLQRESMTHGLAARVHPCCQSVTESWPLDDASAVAAIDTFCYKHQITALEKTAYQREVARVLQPDGLYLLTLAGIDDGYYGPLLAQSPSPTERIILDPANDIASILYAKQDVEREFANFFTTIYYEHKQKEGEMHAHRYLRSTHLFVLKRAT